MKKPSRTISGVAPIAVMLPPRPCPHGLCTFCPALKSPQSYTPKSPVVMRASKVKYSAYKQIKQRIETLTQMGHIVDKIEIIIMGGTFLSYPLDFQYKFILDCYNALNSKKSKDIISAQKLNETSKHRCVALCIETRPDVCSDEDIKRMREFGCTRVEIGVQMPDDEIYDLTKRCHTVQDVVDATKRLKRAGFKLGYHIMPGLPGSNIKKDLKLFKMLFSDERFKPDQVKIYPCQVLVGAELVNDFKSGKFKPYSDKQNKDLIMKMLQVVPPYCRVMRIMREIPKDYLVSGTYDLGLRNNIENELRKKKIKLNEIRYREVGISKSLNKKINENVKVDVIKYSASDAMEYFIQSINDDNILFGLLRLRISEKEAMVRELHVYGRTTAIGEESDDNVQHRGLGKELIKKAEILAKENKKKSIRIISGVGVRQYYKKLGYELDSEGYMIKYL